MKKDYVMTCSVTKDTDGSFLTLTYRLGHGFKPGCMTQVFRLMDADGNPMYYGLMDPENVTHEAQHFYDSSRGCVAIEIFVNGEWKEL